MNIAIFADVHGRVALCFKLCARWQRETGERIDLILQCGDLGAFPDTSRLDSATLRFAEKDPTELGFTEHFAEYREDVDELLSQTTARMIFVRGNHEDHLWLDELEGRSPDPIFAVDAYHRIFCLKTGIPYQFEKGSEHIAIMGIGRITGGSRKSAKLSFIQGYEVRQIARHSHEAPDILITHDIAQGFLGDETGMPEIRHYLDSHRPAYHFFGHIGSRSWRETDDNGTTIACKMADLHWNKSAMLMPGSFGLLRWTDRDHHSFEAVDAPWLAEYGRYSWEHTG